MSDVNVTLAGTSAANGRYPLISGSGQTALYQGPVDGAGHFTLQFSALSHQWGLANGAGTWLYHDSPGTPPGNTDPWDSAGWYKDAPGIAPVPTVSVYVPPEGTASGLVYGGPDCAGVLITFTASGKTTVTATTGSDGTYVSPSLADATWTATVTKSGKTYTGPLTIVMSGGAGVTGQNFEETFSVSGVVETE